MAKFAEAIFGVDISDVHAEHLELYFQERRLESDTLEFKSLPPQANFDDLVNKILKTLCGFLNASGGLLILGAPVKVAVGEVDYFQGVLTPTTVQKSIDWFINKISSGISPMPVGIIIRTITIGESYLYLFQVQESAYKPHQIGGVYYIRLDGQNKPAPHYIVQALMRQITYPDLRAAMRLNRLTINAGERISKLALAIFNFSQLQNEVNYSYTLTLVGGSKLFGWHRHQNYEDIFVDMEGAQIISKTLRRPLHFGMPYVRTFQITIPTDVNELIFLLTFGGKFSPAKTCTYKLDLREIDVNEPQRNITIVEDNQLFKAKKTLDDSLSFFRNNETL